MRIKTYDSFLLQRHKGLLNTCHSVAHQYVLIKNGWIYLTSLHVAKAHYSCSVILLYWPVPPRARFMGRS